MLIFLMILLYILFGLGTIIIGAYFDLLPTNNDEISITGLTLI